MILVILARHKFHIHIVVCYFHQINTAYFPGYGGTIEVYPAGSVLGAIHIVRKGRVEMPQRADGRIGNLPANINIMNPVPNKDARSITQLVRRNGKIAGYQLSDGTVLTKREGVALAKQGGIRGVAIASRNGSEYLRSLPDGDESNNLGDLPSASRSFE